MYTSTTGHLLSLRKNTTPITGVIHVGAYLCEELEDYRRLGVERILWIEGNPELVNATKPIVSERNPPQKMLSAFVSHQNGVETFHTTTVDARNDSLLQPCSWYESVIVKDTFPVSVRRLDKLLFEHQIHLPLYNTLVVDVQGAELKALIGAGDIINQMNFIVSEAWYDELEIYGTEIYPGGTPISKLKYLLENIYGFTETIRTPTDEENPQRTHSWLDVLFERKQL